MDDMQLNQLCEQISQQFQVTAFPAHIFHERRWEVIGNVDAATLAISPPSRIRISETRGIIIYDWRSLSNAYKENVHKIIGVAKKDE